MGNEGLRLDGKETVTLHVSDIEIGAVEIKNSTSDQRATVDTNAELYTCLNSAEKAEGTAATKGVQIGLDDGTDLQFAQCTPGGNLNTDLTTINDGTAIAVNSGVLGAGTQRVTVATDDAMSAALQAVVTAEAAAATKGIQISLDDGTDSQFAQCDASGYLKVDMAASSGTMNVDLDSLKGTTIDVNAGTVSNGTMRVTVATDDVMSAAVQAAVTAEAAAATKGVQISLDDGTDSQFAQCTTGGNLNTDFTTINDGTAVDVNSGVLGGGTQRVTVATDDPMSAGVGTTADAAPAAGAAGSVSAKLRLVTTQLNSLQTALELIDDTVAAEGAAATKGVQISLDDGTDSQFAQCDASGYLKVVGQPRPALDDAWTQLTAPGSTSSLSTGGYVHFAIQYTVASLNTNVVVRLEGSLDNSNWINLDDADADTTITSDGTYGMKYEGAMKYIRFTVVSEAGGTDVTVDARYYCLP